MSSSLNPTLGLPVISSNMNRVISGFAWYGFNNICNVRKVQESTKMILTPAKTELPTKLGSISAALSVLPEKLQESIRGRIAGSFPEQRLVIEPTTKRANRFRYEVNWEPLVRNLGIYVAAVVISL